MDNDSWKGNKFSFSKFVVSMVSYSECFSLKIVKTQNRFLGNHFLAGPCPQVHNSA